MSNKKQIASINRGIRLSPDQLERWRCLAQQAGVNRNRLLGKLIDNAYEEQQSINEDGSLKPGRGDTE